MACGRSLLKQQTAFLVLADWIVGVTGMPVDQSFDIRVVALVVLLLFLYFFVEGRSVTAIQVLLVVSLGVLSLAKFNSLVEA